MVGLGVQISATPERLGGYGGLKEAEVEWEGKDERDAGEMEGQEFSERGKWGGRA